MRINLRSFRRVPLLLIFMVSALLPISLNAQDNEENPSNTIAYALRDEFFNYYALNLIDTSGELIAEIPLDDEQPENYVALCSGPPQWSPDGSQFAFVRRLDDQAAESYGLQELVVYDVESGGIQVVSDNIFRTFDWSPDGQSIIHDTLIEYGDNGQAVNLQGLYRVNLETGADEPMIPALDGYPLWWLELSPDGTRVGFHAPQGMEGLGDFVITNADSSQVAAWSSKAVVGQFDWSPDGSQIVFDDVLYIPETSQLSIADVDDSNMPQNIRVLLEEGVPTAPQWSPDGSLIAFKQPDPTDFRDMLWVIEPDGENPRQVASAEIYSFDWSPDSTALVADTVAGIQIVSLNGNEPQTIAQGGCPAWRPGSE